MIIKSQQTRQQETHGRVAGGSSNRRTDRFHASIVHFRTFWHSNIVHTAVANVAQNQSELGSKGSACVNANVTVEWTEIN